MCFSGDLWFYFLICLLYHKNANILPMRTVKLVVLLILNQLFFSKITTLIVVLIHVDLYYVKPVIKTQRRKKRIYLCIRRCLLSIIIHNLSFFYFQVKAGLCKINVVILLHSVELLISSHHTSLQRMAYLEYNSFWYILINGFVRVSLVYIL